MGLLIGSDDEEPHKVVITCQHRNGSRSWELPKGGMEEKDGDDPERGARREFREETGIMNDLGELASLVGYGNNASIHWYLARLITDKDIDWYWSPTVDKNTLDVKCLAIKDALEILRDDHKQLLRDVLTGISPEASAKGYIQWEQSWQEKGERKGGNKGKEAMGVLISRTLQQVRFFSLVAMTR